MEPTEGNTYTHERTFTPEDVRRFGELSGDRQAIHIEPDEEGRLVVQGLLTATIPTKIGGDLEFIARRMEFGFRRPVYTGQRIVCELTVESVEEREERYEAAASAVCRREGEEVVLRGRVEGIVRK
jgi:acyl dehydratase